jgi:hypothetical protein
MPHPADSQRQARLRRLQLIRRAPLLEVVELAVRRAVAQNFPDHDLALREQLVFDLQREFNYLLRRLGRRVAGTTRSELLRELEEARRNAADAPADQIENYERRIRKLLASLAESDEELARRKLLLVEDHGVASIFREVQGLGRGDPRAALKLDLLRDLFEANLDLRRN